MVMVVMVVDVKEFFVMVVVKAFLSWSWFSWSWLSWSLLS